MSFTSKRDDNYVPAIFGVSSIDKKTPTAIKVNPATGAMLIDAASLETTLDLRYVLKAGDTMTGPLVISETSSTSLIVQSNNTTSTSIAVINTSSGGHSFAFFSTGSANGAGHFGIYDGTSNKTLYDLNGSTGDIGIISGAIFGWSSNSSFANNTFDISFSRLSANNLRLGDGGANENGNLYLNILGIAYATYIQVSRGSNWLSGTHNLIGVTFTDTDQVDIFTPGNTSPTPMITMGANQTLSFFGVTKVIKQTSGANLTNNVTSGGTTDQIDNFTSLTVYATDAAAIRNDIYQLARKMKQINDGLRAYGLLT